MEQRDIEMAADPKRWPRWPWLPIKRYVNGDMQCALLHADTSPDITPVVIYGTNLYQVTSYFPHKDMPIKESFPNWKAFAASDWRVD